MEAVWAMDSFAGVLSISSYRSMRALLLVCLAFGFDRTHSSSLARVFFSRSSCFFSASKRAFFFSSQSTMQLQYEAALSSKESSCTVCFT